MKDLELHGKVRTTTQVARDPGTNEVLATDKVGRLLTAPYQVRDLLSTGTASLSTGTAVTLAGAAGSGVFRDLVHITAANNSSAAASVTLTADGSLIKTLQVPASSTLSIDFNVPVPSPTANTIWVADMEDITGTTVTVDALFVNNI